MDNKLNFRKICWTDRLIINGSSVKGEGSLLRVENPATGKKIISLKQASEEQVDKAVSSAKMAFNSDVWKDGHERRKVLLALADLLEENKEEIGEALIEEIGTPRNLVEPLQLGIPISAFRYYAEFAARSFTKNLGIDQSSNAPSASVIRQLPVGVVAAITAYNYPLLMLGLKLAPALAAGCTAVVLPSPQTPLTSLLFGTLLSKAGVPKGVVNILVGDRNVGKALTQHSLVDKISFTGSVSVGSEVMSQAAKSITGVVLELGGKSASIILPETDLSAVMASVHLRYLRNAGQGCASPTRILIDRVRLEEFVELSRNFFDSVKVGDPKDIDTICGPLISKGHRSRVEEYIAQALKSGGCIAAGGGRPGYEQGWYMTPTVITGVTNGDEICRKELFGPVGVVLPYATVEEAIEIANDSDFGLAAAIFGPIDQAKKVSERLRVGSVYINGGGSIRIDAPMGGFKQSGIGREYGEAGIAEYFEPQHVQWAILK